MSRTNSKLRIDNPAVLAICYPNATSLQAFKLWIQAPFDRIGKRPPSSKRLLLKNLLTDLADALHLIIVSATFA